MLPSASSFFFSPLIILRLGILRFFVLLEKKSSKFFIPFWPLEQFRVFVVFLSLLLGRDQRREGDKDLKEDKDRAALLLVLVFDENNMEVVFVSSRSSSFLRVVVLNALSYQEK